MPEQRLKPGFNDHCVVFRAQRLQGLPAWEYTQVESSRIVDTGRPAHFARDTIKYRAKDTQKTGISHLYSPRWGLYTPGSFLGAHKYRERKDHK